MNDKQLWDFMNDLDEIRIQKEHTELCRFSATYWRFGKRYGVGRGMTPHEALKNLMSGMRRQR